jgi:hypothetical protein
MTKPTGAKSERTLKKVIATVVRRKVVCFRGAISVSRRQDPILMNVPLVLSQAA